MDAVKCAALKPPPPPHPPHTQQPHPLPFGSSEESLHECLYGLHVPGLALCSDPWYLWCLVCLCLPPPCTNSPCSCVLSAAQAASDPAAFTCTPLQPP